MPCMNTATTTAGAAATGFPGLSPEQSAAQSRQRDIQTISLIGLAHGTSHFFHMLLPPLFPVFMREFGLSYSELGLLVTIFFVISGVGQALSGFLVDKTGARPVLFTALGCFVLASLAAGTAQGFGGLALAAALAGLGNSPFHPVDFTILNKRVSQQRLGHAFSVHGITGNLGWAVAPVLLISMHEATGQWRLGYVATAAWALFVIALLFFKRDAIDDTQGSWGHDKAGAKAPADEHPMAFLKLPSVWLCFSFFFFTTSALSAIQSFASPALSAMLVAAALLALTATGWLPATAALIAAATAGFGTGLAGPSRDMLIKRAAPPGATGRVYGTVYSGLDTGFAVAAPIFGALMDRHWNNAVFFGASIALLLGIGAASLVRQGKR